MSIDYEKLLNEIADEILPDIDKTLSKLKHKEDIDAVKEIMLKISEVSAKLISSDAEDKQSLMRALDSYRNALACYKGITAIYAYNLTTRMIGITIATIAKVALTAAVL